MCGIVCGFRNLGCRNSSNGGGVKQNGGGDLTLRRQVLDMAKKLRHRGPDWNGIWTGSEAILAHERLSIVDPSSGKQPLTNGKETLILATNGEIYNHRELKHSASDTDPAYPYKTASDCEVILALYEKHVAALATGKGEVPEKGRMTEFLDKINGIFGFALYDVERDEYLIARDHMGIIPLYMGWDSYGTFWVASELKSLEGVCNRIELFPPGHYVHSGENRGEPVQWYHRSWTEFDAVKDVKTDMGAMRTALEAAVHRQLMSDVPYGVLLSGGLDSSIISALAKKFAGKRVESDDQEMAWWPRLHSFSVGLEGSPDLAAAQTVAKHIGTVHHEIKFTVQEGLDAIRDVIYHLETYDITTVRASTPMYLMARVIKSMGIKMVLSGEGADELFGGYLYFHKAPNAQEFHEETVRKVAKLYQYDCLRANKSLAAWGVEGRVPFLDKEFIDVAMSGVNPTDKMIIRPPKDATEAQQRRGIEKWVLRQAFEDCLPTEVCWRQKEQFSDGVGYSWIDSLKAVVNEAVTDAQMSQASYRFPKQPPATKEEYYYRSIFEEHYPSETAALTVPSVPSVACSTPVALAWDESFRNCNEPSGRAIAAVHDSAY